MEHSESRELSQCHVTKAYRSSVKENWLLNYFTYPEYPEFIDSSLHDRIQNAVLGITEVIYHATDLLLSDQLTFRRRNLLDCLDIPNHAMYWLKKFYKPGQRVLWGRPDFHISEGKPYLLEANLAGAAGYQQQVTGLIDYYGGHPHLFDKHESGGLRFLDPLVAMRSAFERIVPSGETLLIADIYEEWRHKDCEVPPYGGLMSWLNLNSNLKVRSAFVHELDFSSEGISFKGEKIDHVFLSYYNPHVFDRFGEFLPFWDLFQRGKVNIVDGFEEVFWSNKLLLAYLSEFIDGLDFPSDSVSRFKDTVPWTRIIREGTTEYQGETFNISELAKSDKDNFVVKKAQSAEGKMVFVGNQVPQSNWDETIDQVLNTEDWIIQEFIPPEVTTVLLPDDKGGFHKEKVAKSISPYVTGSSICGYLNRFYKIDPGVTQANSARAAALKILGTSAIVDRDVLTSN